MPLNFSQPIPHVVDRLHTVPPLPRRRPRRQAGISICTLNIQYGWGFELAQAIRAAERGFFDMMLLNETNIKLEAYSHNRFGYGLTC